MNPFDYQRASASDTAISAITGPSHAKFLAGGTNLIDLMKNGVERPERLVDINRLPLEKIEPLPTREDRTSSQWRVTSRCPGAK